MINADSIQFEAHSWIQDAVHRRRSSGLKRAVTEVSRLYGIGERRVIAYLRNEVRRPPAHEYLAMRERARADLEQWARASDEAAACARARLAEWTP